MGNMPDRVMLRNGIYYARFCVPKAAAESFGRKAVVMSLHTRDPRTARSRLASRTVEFESSFARKITSGNFRPGLEQHTKTSTNTSANRIPADLPALTRRHAAAVPETLFASRAELFEAAANDFAGLLAGNLVSLPPSTGGDGVRHSVRAYFDHLATGGDLEQVVGFLNRFRLRQRIQALHSMRSSGNIREFVDLAQAQDSELNRADTLTLARLLL